MMSNPGKYSKDDSFRELRQAVGTTVRDVETRIAQVVKDVSSHYTKGEGTISARLFIIVSGGEEKERQYFARLKDTRFSRQLRIEFVCKGREGLTAKRIFDVAKEIKEKIKDSIDEHEADLFFLLSDRDHFYPELCEILPLCKKEPFNLIVSNPCFEVWLYYGHFDLHPEKNGFSYDDIKKVSSGFKTFLGERVRGGSDPKKAIFHIETAIANAKLHYATDEAGIPVMFATDMFVLGEHLIDLIKPELDKITKENKELALRYKSETGKTL